MSQHNRNHGERVIDEILSLPVPTGWVRTRVADIGEVRLGRQRSPKNRSADYPTKYLRAANITWNGVDVHDVLDMEFRPAELATYRLLPGDVLLSEASGSASEVGKPALWNGELENCCFQNTVIRFRPTAVESKFALVAFQHFARNAFFSRVAKGVGIHHLSADRFASMPFLLPPLKEQRRIVAKIEELFSDLDAGVAALERAKANLKRYRAAVLKAAVEGKLTELTPEDADCFKRSRWRSIGEAIESLGQGWSPKCDRTPSDDPKVWGVIKTSAVQSLQFLEHENKRLPDTLEPRPHLEVNANDLLITRAGPRSRCAVTCMVRSTRPRLINCDKVYRIRSQRDVATPGFLELILNAPPILDRLDELKTGISDSGVNLTQSKFRELEIPLPSIKTQQQIEDEVQWRLSLIENAQNVLTATEARASRLRQSILKRAFEGKLVPQDANDEPATQLLARIKSNREAQFAIESVTNQSHCKAVHKM